MRRLGSYPRMTGWVRRYLWGGGYGAEEGEGEKASMHGRIAEGEEDLEGGDAKRERQKFREK